MLSGAVPYAMPYPARVQWDDPLIRSVAVCAGSGGILATRLHCALTWTQAGLCSRIWTSTCSSRASCRTMRRSPRSRRASVCSPVSCVRVPLQDLAEHRSLSYEYGARLPGAGAQAAARMGARARLGGPEVRGVCEPGRRGPIRAPHMPQGRRCRMRRGIRNAGFWVQACRCGRYKFVLSQGQRYQVPPVH